MPLSPVLRAQATYPFVRLTQAANKREGRGLEVIDLGMGDLQEPTDPRIIAALRNGVRERMGKDTIVVTEPGYPVPERDALFAGVRILALPLREEHAFLPALDALDGGDWSRAALVWVNYPNNPTGATATSGEGYARFALVARLEECERAVEILEDVL